MSAIGMLGASIMESIMSKNNQGGSQNFMREFQQLGRDLQSGNISQAQSDLAGLQKFQRFVRPAVRVLASHGPTGI